jgi:hypothetical protein
MRRPTFNTLSQPEAAIETSQADSTRRQFAVGSVTSYGPSPFRPSRSILPIFTPFRGARALDPATTCPTVPSIPIVRIKPMASMTMQTTHHPALHFSGTTAGITYRMAGND